AGAWPALKKASSRGRRAALPALLPPPPVPQVGARGRVSSSSSFFLASPPGSDSGRRLEGHVAHLVAHALLPGAPAGIHAVRAALQERIDLADLALLELEHLGDLPGVRLHRTGHDLAARRRPEAARLAAGVIEEGECEHDAALLVDGDET